MSFTVFLGNLPVWVTKDDIKSWLNAENLVYDDVKVIRNPETQESKGFAFIDTPNSEEMNSIIRRFGESIWCTFAGLVATIILLFINSFLEPGFNRLAENRLHVRETVARVKRELALANANTAAEETAP